MKHIFEPMFIQPFFLISAYIEYTGKVWSFIFESLYIHGYCLSIPILSFTFIIFMFYILYYDHILTFKKCQILTILMIWYIFEHTSK